jgi:hypothetical protein
LGLKGLEHFFADEVYAVRVHLVQEGKLASLVPPQRRQARKVRNLGIVDGRNRRWWWLVFGGGGGGGCWVIVELS